MSIHRQESEVGIYHLMVRGCGRIIIFEDDHDRIKYLELASSAFAKEECAILAWCLMDNHAHFLVQGQMNAISKAMCGANGNYARAFNYRHDHTGHLFQGRFVSKPITSEAQLLQTVRYIHRNPAEAGLCDYPRYKWGSYKQYLSKNATKGMRDILELLNGTGGFVAFHENGETEMAPIRMYTPNGEEAPELFKRILEKNGLHEMPVHDKERRDRILAELRSNGLTIKQIGRLTGIGRSIIARARM